jgi:multidrug efflux pump subunit AcrB
MKQFKPTSWSINNRTSIYILVAIIAIFGVWTYNKLQKERFPDIVIPTIYVATPYPGTSPADMENLITRPIEQQVKAISGVKKVTSSSVQDYSAISVEFNTGIRVEDAKQKVKDAVDKAKLPQDLPIKPTVMDINLSEIPILQVNLAGNYPMEKLKKWAEDLQDKIEGYSEITRADIIGALDREVKVDVDMYRMQAAKVSMQSIINAITYENMTISGGNVKVGEQSRAIRVVGQFVNADSIGNIVVKSAAGAPVYLKDIATVTLGFQKRESYARLDHAPVISLSVIKRSGENLINASDHVQEAVAELKKSEFPSDLKVTITGDQSVSTRNTLNDLLDSIIIGFILVTLILMFFMGTTNALFVALSVPISSLLAFMLMPLIGGMADFHYTLNMIVLFSFLLALGIVVDDAIVVIENTHRIFHQKHMTIVQAAKEAAGEVFVPVFAGTMTTIAPFFPLLFWPGIVGSFMFYLPITLILVLFMSLVVAFIINPIFAVSFMGKEGEDSERKNSKQYRNWMIALGAIALVFYLARNIGIGNLIVFIMIFITLNRYVFSKWIAAFQNKALPRFMHGYERLVRWIIVKRRPIYTLLIIGGVLVISVVVFIIRILIPQKVEFFPKGDPNFVYVYLEMPVGTDVSVTDSVTRILEKRVYSVIGENNTDVESVISNVAVGAGDPSDFNRATSSNKGKVTVAFKEFKYRKGPSTTKYLDEIREKMKGIPGAKITVDQERNGPPTGKPINIEISGDDYPTLIKLSKNVKSFIDSSGINGIEELKSNLEDKNPEIVVNVNRDKSNREGISTAQIGQELRWGVFGQDNPTKFKIGEDEYPIQVRYAPQYRDDINAIQNLDITYRDMNTGLIKQVPLRSVADVSYGTSFGGINRKNLKRVITLSSNLLTGYTPNEVVGNITQALKGMKVPQGYEIKMTGEQEDQQETASFLGFAGMLSIFLIFFILVLQFNSVSKPVIILTEILFSIIGVLLGFSIFGMTISIVMTGVGIVALGGIVVKNGILLVEFTDELRARGVRTTQAIVQAGRTRLTPVLLTASATMLGLVPLAIGMNIDFFTLFSRFDPQFFVGGESKTFWGPLAWTIIFGLFFATFLTLLVVPAMYMLNHRLKIWLKRRRLLPKGYRL